MVQIVNARAGKTSRQPGQPRPPRWHCCTDRSSGRWCAAGADETLGRCQSPGPHSQTTSTKSAPQCILGIQPSPAHSRRCPLGHTKAHIVIRTRAHCPDGKVRRARNCDCLSQKRLWHGLRSHIGKLKSAHRNASDNIKRYQRTWDFEHRYIRYPILVDNAVCYQSCVDIRFSLVTICVISRASIFDSG